MNKSNLTKLTLAFAVALSLSSGLAGIAHADQLATAPLTAQQQQPQTPAVVAYDRGVNPEATVHNTGIYDQADLYRDAHGNPLPGYGTMFGDTDNM